MCSFAHETPAGTSAVLHWKPLCHSSDLNKLVPSSFVKCLLSSSYAEDFRASSKAFISECPYCKLRKLCLPPHTSTNSGKSSSVTAVSSTQSRPVMQAGCCQVVVWIWKVALTLPVSAYSHREVALTFKHRPLHTFVSLHSLISRLQVLWMVMQTKLFIWEHSLCQRKSNIAFLTPPPQTHLTHEI